MNLLLWSGLKFFIFDHVESEKWPHLAETEKGRSKVLICWKVSKNLPVIQ